MSKTKPTTVKTKDFDIKRFYTTPLQKNERLQGTHLGYPFYKYKNGEDKILVVQTKQIKITQYGQPNPDNKYYEEESKRNFIKIPHDESQETCKEFFDVLDQIDNYIEKNEKDLLGKLYGEKKDKNGNVKLPKHTHHKLDKEPPEIDEEDMEPEALKKKRENEEKYGTPMNSCKIKFDIDYDTKNLKTKFFLKELDGKRRYLDIKRESELREYIKLGCKIRMIIMFNKFYADKTVKLGKRNLGVGMKLLQMEIEPREEAKSLKDDFQDCAFDSSDDEDNKEEKKQETKKDEKENTKEKEESKKEDKEVESSDDESERTDNSSLSDDEDN